MHLFWPKGHSFFKKTYDSRVYLEKFFIKPRIIVRQIVSGEDMTIFAGYSDESLYHTQIGFSIIENEEELLESIVNIQPLISKYEERNKEFYDKYCVLNDGKSSERVLDILLSS